MSDLGVAELVMVVVITAIIVIAFRALLKSIRSGNDKSKRG